MQGATVACNIELGFVSVRRLLTDIAAMSLTPKHRFTSWTIILSLPPSPASLVSTTTAICGSWQACHKYQGSNVDLLTESLLMSIFIFSIHNPPHTLPATHLLHHHLRSCCACPHMVRGSTLIVPSGTRRPCEICHVERATRRAGRCTGCRMRSGGESIGRRVEGVCWHHCSCMSGAEDATCAQMTQMHGLIERAAQRICVVTGHDGWQVGEYSGRYSALARESGCQWRWRRLDQDAERRGGALAQRNCSSSSLAVV